MLLRRSSSPPRSGVLSDAAPVFSSFSPRPWCGSLHLPRSLRALTLVEVMFALLIQAMVMLAIIGSFIHSRRITEGSVLHAAASSLVYGIIEQMKGLDYDTSIPNLVAGENPTGSGAPFVQVRVNQDEHAYLRVVYTPSGSTPKKGPLTTPDATATAVSLGAIDNRLDNLPLSTVTGSTSQTLGLELWVWIDELEPLPARGLAEVKKVTVVYTYHYMDGNRRRTIRDREVFLRTKFSK